MPALFLPLPFTCPSQPQASQKFENHPPAPTILFQPFQPKAEGVLSCTHPRHAHHKSRQSQANAASKTRKGHPERAKRVEGPACPSSLHHRRHPSTPHPIRAQLEPLTPRKRGHPERAKRVEGPACPPPTQHRLPPTKPHPIRAQLAPPLTPRTPLAPLTPLKSVIPSEPQPRRAPRIPQPHPPIPAIHPDRPTQGLASNQGEHQLPPFTAYTLPRYNIVIPPHPKTTRSAQKNRKHSAHLPIIIPKKRTLESVIQKQPDHLKRAQRDPHFPLGSPHAPPKRAKWCTRGHKDALKCAGYNPLTNVLSTT